MTMVKICGITRVEDAVAAARLGAHAVGFVFYGPSPRNVSVDRAMEIARRLPPFVTTVGLFVNAVEADVKHVLSKFRLDLLQFHGEEPPEYCRAFGVAYVKAVRVKPGVDLIKYAKNYDDARGLLLDAYVAGVHGGTGTSFDWGLIPDDLPLPVVLSGGLTPANVEDAIRHVRPWAVDVSSGVEVSAGIKDTGKLAAFFRGVRNADV